MASSSSAHSDASAIAAACAAHDAAEVADEIAALLADEPFIGSALDVRLAIEGIVEPASEALCEALFAALGRSGKRARLSELPAAAGSGIGASTWKREYKSARERFQEPYSHPLHGRTLLLQQAAFEAEGFASTVWDSSIVLARYLEKEAAAGRRVFAGTRCIELGAGCGLPGLVLSALGAHVVLTDLEDNLPLLRANVEQNGPACRAIFTRASAGLRVEAPTYETALVEALRWGRPPPQEDASGGACDPGALPPIALVIATDVLYSHDAVEPLVETLEHLAGRAGCPTEVLLAAGRNRHAGDDFFARVGVSFDVQPVPAEALDETFRCDDVAVWVLRARVSKE